MTISNTTHPEVRASITGSIDDCFTTRDIQIK